MTLGRPAAILGVAALGLFLSAALLVGDWSAAPRLDPVPATGRFATTARPDRAVARENVQITVRDGSRVRATVLVPDGDRPRPGLVMIGGAGAGDHAALMRHADALAGRGIAVMVPEKNLTGYSVLRRDFEGLADDALAAAASLGDHAAVRGSTVGLWGHSEGAWVAAAAAAKSPDLVDQLILVSPPVVTPGEQANWIVDGQLQRGGVSGRWRALVGLTLSEGSRFINYLDYRAPYGQLSQPVLAVWGSEDAAVPTSTALRSLREAVPDLAVQVYAQAGHRLLVAGAPPPEAAGAVADWIAAPGPGQVIQAPLVQEFEVPADPDVRPTAAGALAVSQLVLVASVLLVAVAGIRGLLRKIIIHRRRTP